MSSTILRAPLQSVDAARLRELQEMYPKAELQIAVAPTESGLSGADFWRLIALLDWSKTGDDAAVVEPLVQRLAASPLRTIYDFQDRLSAKLFELDRKAIARVLGWRRGQYFSVDLFLYARCCVVAKGQKAFESVLANPKTMPQDVDFEPLLNVAADAFERKTGKNFDFQPARDHETYANLEGWE